MDIIKQCLDNIEEGRYEEYLNDKEQGKVVFEKIYNNPTGFIYVKDNIENYGIRFSFLEGALDMDLYYEEIAQYINEKETIYILTNGLQKKVVSYFQNKGFKEQFSAFLMELKKEDYQPETFDSLPLTPYQKEHFDSYIEVLGKAFYTMRADLDLKPYDWYLHNKIEAHNTFEKLREKDSIFGYFINEELVGVLMLDEEWLDTIAVKESYQGQKIGTRLLQMGIHILFKKFQQKRVILGVISTNEKASLLYQKRGFQYKTKMTVLLQEGRTK